MKKILLKDFVFQGRVHDHDLIKDKLLWEINNAESESLDKSETRFESLSRFDWCNAENMNREWIKLFKPHFQKVVDEFLTITPYLSIELVEMWFQQYIKYDMHDWHTHGEQYTGVYYLEFPHGSSMTEIVTPYDHIKQLINVVEGDIIFFPAHVAHRGTTNLSKRKTIISFNFSIGNDYDDIINHEMLNSLRLR